MSTRIRKWATSIMMAALFLALVPIGVASAHSANSCSSTQFCAYRHSNYGTKLVTASTTTNNAFVDVANNLVSSAQNHTTANYCGVTAEGWPNQTIYRAAPSQHNSYVGSESNDKIDHFYVRSGGSSCD